MRASCFSIAAAVLLVTPAALASPYAKTGCIELGGSLGASFDQHTSSEYGPEYTTDTLQLSVAPELFWFFADGLALTAGLRGAYSSTARSPAKSSTWMLGPELGLAWLADFGGLYFGPRLSVGYLPGAQSRTMDVDPNLAGSNSSVTPETVESTLSESLVELGFLFKVPVGSAGLLNFGPTLSYAAVTQKLPVRALASELKFSVTTIRFDLGYSVHF